MSTCKPKSVISPNSVRISELSVEMERQVEAHSETERKLLSVGQGILNLVSVIYIIHSQYSAHC